MLFDLIDAIQSGSADALKWAFAGFLLSLPIIILAISVHEIAHGFVANKLGDPTAKNMGRLTLNPAKHFDPIGFLCMVAFGFGWAKPVPISTRNFKKPRRDMAISAIAGPISNILLAFLFAGLLKIFWVILARIPLFEATELTINILSFIRILLELGIHLNITFAIFNLLPIPPLDGSKILYMFLPQKTLIKFLEYERYIALALLILLAVGALSWPLNFVTGKIINLISFIFNMPL